jgi:hypothetical protein
VYRILAIKPERKRLRGRPSHIWENNMKRDLMKIWFKGVCGLISCDSG